MVDPAATARQKRLDFTVNARRKSMFLHFAFFISHAQRHHRDETPSKSATFQKFQNAVEIQSFSSKRLQILEFLFKTPSNHRVSKRFRTRRRFTFSSMMGSQFQKLGGRQGSMPMALVTPLRLSSRPCSLQHQ